MPVIINGGTRTLRIHFGVEDLANTRCAGTPLPMFELVFGVRARDFDRAMLPAIAPLAELIRPSHGVPDFFSSPQPKFVDAVGEVLQAASGGSWLPSLGTTSPWLRSFARGDARARMELRTALHNYHRLRLAPAWNQTVQTFDAEIRSRARHAFTDGLGAVLAKLHPAIRWEAPVLHVESSWEGDVHLNGRGLLVVPSVNAAGPAAALFSGAQPILCYPVTATETTEVSLEGALGRTRTEVLRALTTERSTTDLARHVGISLPTASQHATALRCAGFVSTQRDGRAVKHRLTQRGWELLN
ncbi:ArsR family transcriptional regulator [Lentzea sp. NBRC 105346]|uniref:ArsR/SmtB family transcription factor n=1 Tax=Lentzea sp. NBRC 105346 TaxID=3032205 RepID=UPI002557886F|nr:ArsR family transcriptional regulator [Lentzea sp. NBRC 105346]